MKYDFAIVYFGLTRSTKKVYKSHIHNIFNKLKNNKLNYKIFIHTWKTNDNKQKVQQQTISKEIDYNEYKLLNPDFYMIENQNDFIQTVDMNKYFYKKVWDKKGQGPDGEWPPGLIINHLCALESQKRGLEMVEKFVEKGNTFKYVMFVRPDVLIHNKLPLKKILLKQYEISIPNEKHYFGYNDRFAIINYNKATIYGKRINEIADFRKSNGRITSEKYVKFIITKYKLKLKKIKFSFDVVRPCAVE